MSKPRAREGSSLLKFIQWQGWNSHHDLSVAKTQLPAMQETGVRSLCQEDSLEEEMAAHPSILAWRIPWTEEPGGLQSMGSQRVGHDWVTNTFTSLSPSNQHWFSGQGGLLEIVQKNLGVLMASGNWTMHNSSLLNKSLPFLVNSTFPHSQ